MSSNTPNKGGTNGDSSNGGGGSSSGGVNTGGGSSAGGSTTTTNSLLEHCLKKLDNAVAKGSAMLLSRYEESHHAMHGRTELSYGPQKSHTHSRPVKLATGTTSKKSLLDASGKKSDVMSIALAGSTVLSLSREETESLARVKSVFDMGRYMMMAAGLKQITNLQGVWSEGKESTWNGDYHININLQMNYWPCDVAALPETVPPLFSFVRRLRQHSGVASAKFMYGAGQGGWVAHGFMDGFLDGGLASAPHWALCVTCGAWTGDYSLSLCIPPSLLSSPPFLLSYHYHPFSVYYNPSITTHPCSFTTHPCSYHYHLPSVTHLQHWLYGIISPIIPSNTCLVLPMVVISVWGEWGWG